MSLTTWVILIFLVAATALYVAAEFASVSVRRSRIQQLAEQGNGQARRLLPVLEDPHQLDQYIAACQIGITLSSLILGAYGQATLTGWLTPHFAQWGSMGPAAAHSAATVAVLIVLTAMHVLLGELVPKSVALTYPEQTALYTALPMRWSQWLYSWFIAVLNGSGLWILKRLGLGAAGHRHIHSPDEIDLLIAESRDGGLLEPEESERLHRALQLGIRPVRQLMVDRTHMLAMDVETPVEQALRVAADSPYTRIPVYRGSVDRVVGLIHVKDLLLRRLEKGGLTRLEQAMRPVLVVPETLPADRLLERLREQRAHMAIVADEYGGVAGLVTLEDVLGEVLGQVADEFKGAEVQPERLVDGRVRLPGLMRPDEAEPWIRALWRGGADTMGGLALEALGHVPAPGERLTIDGSDVEVERVENRAIVSLLVAPRPAGEEDRHG